jgi:hypothetical protein
MPPEITRERLNFSMNRKVKWRILTKRKDSFGRQYIVWVDRNNLEPTGQIERYFTVPIQAYVPDEYLKFPEEKPWKVEVLWERYALYLKAALREWQAIVKFHMKKLYGAKGVGAEPTAEAIEAAGPPPQDWRIIVLASRGDPYFLGLTKTLTPAARKLLPDEPMRVPTKKAIVANRELRLDPELEKLIGRTKVREPEELDEQGEDELAEKELEAEARRLAREMDAEEGEDADDVAAEEEEEIQSLMDPDEDEGILVGGLSDEEIFQVEESADPGAIGGTRVKIGSEKSRAKSKGRTRKTGG